MNGHQAKVSTFDRFWAAYPKRDGGDPRKPAAEKFAAAVKRGVDPEVIIRGAENYGADIKSRRTEPRFVAMAATWLHQERWNDHQHRAAPQPRPSRPMAFEG